MRKTDGRLIQFAGESWHAQTGQGSPREKNNWSDLQDAVWVDDEGCLHLSVVKRDDGIWYSSEIKSLNTCGHGEYTFYLSGDVGYLDKNIVIGMFMYFDDADPNEIDIEIADFYEPPTTNKKLYHVLHLNEQGSVYNFDTHIGINPPIWMNTTQKFTWDANAVVWQAYCGHHPSLPAPSSLIKETIYNGIPRPEPGKSRLYINFWLLDPDAGPSDRRNTEIVIKNLFITKLP